jgi:hypothetical protein
LIGDVGSRRRILAVGFGEQAEIARITRRAGRRKNIFCPFFGAALSLPFVSLERLTMLGDWYPVCIKKIGEGGVLYLIRKEIFLGNITEEIMKVNSLSQNLPKFYIVNRHG